MSDKLDCRGLACPEPVLKTKAALENISEGVVSIIVDNTAARDNVRRFAESQGCSATMTELPDGCWEVNAAKGYSCDLPRDMAVSNEASVQAVERPLAILITSDTIGSEPELGKVLMRAFLNTLPEAGNRPDRLLFLNRAVFLTSEGSEAIPVLRELEDGGTNIFSCGTCLEFFNRRDLLLVGQVSNMYDTVETLTGTHRVITIC